MVFYATAKGEMTDLKLPRGAYAFPRVSPDGRSLAIETSDGKQSAISVFELSESSLRHYLTFSGNNRVPIWSGDSRRVVFQSDREGDRGLFISGQVPAARPSA